MWTEPIVFEEESGGTRSDIAVGSDDSIHIVYKTLNDELIYRAVLPDGTLTLPSSIYTMEGSRSIPDSPQIVVDGQDRIHVLCDDGANQGERRIYLAENPGANWSAPLTLYSDSLLAVDMALDPYDGLHIVGTPEYDFNIQYLYKPAESAHFEYFTVPVTVQSIRGISIAIDPANKTSLVWAEYEWVYFRSTALAEQAEAVSLLQSFHIPDQAHAPTLAFSYGLDSLGNIDDSTFDLAVTHGLTTTQVVSSSVATDWTHRWLDLAPWAGQTITVTFRLNQAAAEPLAHLRLDDVSAGSWLTPVVQDVSPAQIAEGWGSGVLTITGENFIPTPSVRLGDAELLNVLWLDENTLQATVPGNLPFGLYDVWVVNPGGQEAAIPSGFRAGAVTYIPLSIHSQW